MAAGAPLLYVHPRGHLNELVVPAGALACMNAAPGPRLGRYAFEVSDEELRAARVVAVDVHWALALAGLPSLLARVRRVNPAARVVAGGITAGLYPGRLLEAPGVDYVLQGDAEETFAALVAALLAGREPGDLPNLWRPGRPARLARMDAAAFDATDCLTADWFPTLARVRDWPCAAFPMTATLPLARGCALRCPGCYGSYAETFGPGVLVRSPAGLVRELQRARALGLRGLRLVAGKLTEARLLPLLEAAAAAGPLHLERGVAVYLCAPPSAAALDALEAAFGGGAVTISVVPPAEHVPRPPPAELAAEEAGWRAAAARVRRSEQLGLDAWTEGRETAAAARRLLEPDGRRVQVSQGSVWRMTRPPGEARPPFEAVRAAVAPLWTFYAARLLSPALARLLERFRLLDELREEEVPAPPGALAAWHEVIRTGWGRDRLPTLPGLAFWAAPLPAAEGAARPPRGELRLHGAARWVAAPGAPLAPPFPLAVEEDETGVRLRGAPPAGALAFALLPAPPAGAPDARWWAAVAADGLVAIAAPPGEPGHIAEVRVALRVQEAELALLDGAGRPVARGRAELGYFEPPRPR